MLANTRFVPHQHVGAVDVPPYLLGTFTGSNDTLETMRQQAWGDRGERSMLVRELTESVVRDVWPKDYMGEILAIRNFCTTRLRYTNDQSHVELVRDPQNIAERILAEGVALVDCDEIAEMIGTMCMQVGREANFVVAGFDAPGDYSHVFCVAVEPKSQKRVCLDPVAGTTEREMLGRVTCFALWKLDDDSPGPHEVWP